LSAAICLLLVSLVAGAAAAAIRVVELTPDRRAGWSPASLFAPITGLFRGGPGYWYDAREILIDTTPKCAYVDLFYVRGNFQLAYEQTESPVRVVLPSRIDAAERDSLTVRIMADGYQPKDVHVRVRSRTETLEIDLEPLANTLQYVDHFYLAGRGTLTFLTQETLTFRNQKADGGFSVVLLETAGSERAMDGIASTRSPLIDSLQGRQLGQDLVVRVALSRSAQAYEIRSRQSYDPVRRLYSFSLDLIPPVGGAAEIERSREALARILAADVTGCAELFDRVVREELDAEQLARALDARNRHLERYVRAAMERLGQVSPGRQVRLIDGTRFDVSVPIELAAAASQASLVVGYLALLRGFVNGLEPPDFQRSTLKGIVAPEISGARFDAIMDLAEAREHRCAAGREGP